MPVAERRTLRFGPFELDPQIGQLRKNGLGVKLQGQPVQILEILLEKPGQLVTREEIRQRLWASDTFVDFDHSLNTAVKKLRQALGDEADTPRYIETLPKRGYRFTGELVREEAKEQPKTDTPETAAVAVLPLGQLEPRPQSAVFRRKGVVIGVALGLLVIASGLAVYTVLKPEPQPRIVGSHVLTKTGNLKWFNHPPFVDRGFIYFPEQRTLGGEKTSGWVLLMVPAAGGEVSAGPAVNGGLRDISRDGTQLLSITQDSTGRTDLWAQAAPSGVPRLVVVDTSGFALWTSDARGLFFARNNDTELYRASTDGTGVKRMATIPGFQYPHLSPDGARLRFTENENTFRLWEVGTDGRNLRQLLGGRKDVWGGSWSPDGRYYFFSGWDGDRWSLWAVSEAHHWWKRAEASQPYPLTFGPMSIGAPGISNDGKQLYAVGMERHGELSVYDSKAGKFVPYLGGTSVCYVDFSRDGKWIAYVSYPEGALWRSRIDGSERRQLTLPPLAVINPRWSPDGKLIAFTDLANGDRSKMTDESPRRVYVVSADGGGPELLLAGNLGDPTWSADGNSIAYDYRSSSPASAASEVRILDLQTQKSAPVPGSQGMWSARWSPDGRYLVALSAYPPKKLMLFNFASNTWGELASGTDFGWPSWSRDSKFVYAQDGNSLVRIAISDHKKEPIASLQGFRGTAYYMDRWNQGWLGLAPDGRPITTRDTGIEEIYAFDLEYK
jgi:DNA-binding winged helix-turn-helix (wHTH) protein/Tol biopolymer transport system component